MGDEDRYDKPALVRAVARDRQPAVRHKAIDWSGLDAALLERLAERLPWRNEEDPRSAHSAGPPRA